jgi:Dyp-type peroxidase family
VLEFGDIQGIVFSGYQKKSHASYMVLRITDAEKAKSWLRTMSQIVTTGNDHRKETAINLALTATALTALGVGDGAFQTFPLEFREGLAGSDTRSRTLGDVGTSDPSRWLWGHPNQRFDVLLMLFAHTAESLEDLIAAQRKGFEGAAHPIVERTTQSLPDRREHFGFSDGIAQPVIRGSRQDAHGVHTIEPGEFILGYPNAYGKQPFVPNVDPALDIGEHLAPYEPDGKRRALGRNGSYMVVRQLDQHVSEFWNYMRAAASRLNPAGTTPADGAIRLAAKCVGRWPSGAPLVKAPESDNRAFARDNDFGYFSEDRYGERCPIGAHIRRANPRDSLEPDPSNSERVVDRHRVLRRGRSYGPPVERPWEITADDGKERGLFFICINANIRRQFEFIQQTWVNNRKFGGLYEERDPLIGENDGTASEFTIPGKPARHRLEGLPRFVEMRGGGYFFLPSVRALKFLASLPLASGQENERRKPARPSPTSEE